MPNRLDRSPSLLAISLSRKDDRVSGAPDYAFPHTAQGRWVNVGGDAGTES